MPAASGRDPAGGLRAVVRGESLWLFLLVLAVLGCFVNTRNQVTWNLQHAWVESLGERGVMHLEGSPTPRFALYRLVDVWTSPDGHTYARNAPGTYFTGAAVYCVLQRAFGLSYLRDFDLTSTLVTFFTTCLSSALVFLLLYRLAKQVTGSRLGGVCVAAAYSFGTLAFPYSGALYQHQTAAVFFVACFSLAYQRRRSGDERWFRPAVEGLLLGLGAVYSFAYFPMGLGIAAYCLLPLARKRSAWFLAGVALGIAPLLVLNTLYYGGPLTTVYQASRDYQVTTLDVSWAAIARRLHFYFSDPTTGVFFYSPVLLLSLPGLLRFPRKLRREQLTIAGGALLTLSHLLVASGIGALQFGPRLLLPTLPFLALALFPFWMRESGRNASSWTRPAFVLLLVTSIAFCALGALGTTMFRDVARWNAWYVYLRSLFPPVPEGMPVYNLPIYKFPLRHVLAWVSLGMGLVAAWRLLALRQEPETAPSDSPTALASSGGENS
jgi:hypothetical protein